MKTRIVVHIALNAKNERVGVMAAAAGKFIPFGDSTPASFKNRAASKWIEMKFGGLESVDCWKEFAKQSANAVRFQRVTLIGESK